MPRTSRQHVNFLLGMAVVFSLHFALGGPQPQPQAAAAKPPAIQATVETNMMIADFDAKATTAGERVLRRDLDVATKAAITNRGRAIAAARSHDARHRSDPLRERVKLPPKGSLFWTGSQHLALPPATTTETATEAGGGGGGLTGPAAAFHSLLLCPMLCPFPSGHSLRWHGLGQHNLALRIGGTCGLLCSLLG